MCLQGNSKVVQKCEAMSCEFFFLRGITLFRPSHLNNKFEDKTVAYTEQKMTTGKIKKFIQENMYVPLDTS